MSTRRILIIGSYRDGTCRYVHDRLIELGVDFDVVWADEFLRRGTVHYSSESKVLTIGEAGGDEIHVDETYGVYARLFDFEAHELSTLERAEREKKRILLTKALQVSPARVVPRPYDDAGNDSKPLQAARLAKFGFKVPRGVATNNPEHALHFIERCPNGAIYKSVGGERSIVRTVDAEKLEDIQLISKCPVFFQEYIKGPDVRLHIVGRHYSAEIIEASSVDYRYADAKNRIFSRHQLPQLPKEVVEKAFSFARLTGNQFLGFDFKVCDRTGEYYCLEANPNPGFEGYDFRSGGEIMRGLVETLLGEAPMAKSEERASL
jgi:hypothetical protein